MNICSYNHEEIVYASKDCPLCSALEDIRFLADNNELLESTLDDVETNYNALTKLVAKHAPELLI